MSVLSSENWSADATAITPTRGLNGSLRSVWAAYASGHRLVERNLLIENYTSMVAQRSRQVKTDGSGMTAADLIQEGMIALVRCVETYDSLKGAAFTTYAYRPVLDAMRKAVRRGRFGPNDYRTPNPGSQLWFVPDPAAINKAGDEL